MTAYRDSLASDEERARYDEAAQSAGDAYAQAAIQVTLAWLKSPEETAA